jgi:hypothetical protein
MFNTNVFHLLPLPTMLAGDGHRIRSAVVRKSAAKSATELPLRQPLL